MYVAEICPAAKTAVEAFESKYIPENECEGGEKDNFAGDIEMAPLRGFIQRASFTGLRKGVKYTVKVRTVVNGKTICQVSEDIEKDQENMPTETQDMLLLSCLLFNPVNKINHNYNIFVMQMQLLKNPGLGHSILNSR